MKLLSSLIKKAQKYHVLLLLTGPVLLWLAYLLDSMVWTSHKKDFSYLFVNLDECLTFAGQVAVFLWTAFFAKHMLRVLREFLAKKFPIFAEEPEAEEGQPRRKGAVKTLSPRELINIVYYVLDAACIVVWIYMAFTYLKTSWMSSSPIDYAKYFVKLLKLYPYTIQHALLAGGVFVGGGLVLFLTRKQRSSLMSLWEGVILYGLINLVAVLLGMFAKLDINLYALWATLTTSVFIVANLTYGIIRQLPRFGNMNFALLRPILPKASKAELEAAAERAAERAAKAQQRKEEQERREAEAAQAEKPAEAPAAPAHEAAPAAEAPAVKAEKPAKAAKPAKEKPVKPAKAAKPVPAQAVKVEATAAEEDEDDAAAREAEAKILRAENTGLSVHERAQRRVQREAAKAKAEKFTLEERTGLSFKSLWTIRFTANLVPYLVLFMGLVLWLSTAMYTIQPNEQALVYRFGKLQEESVTNPGLHFKLPDPFDKVEITDVQRMRSMYVGYAPAESNDYLWTSEHGGEEYTLLLGNGNELVAVNMRLNYFIEDLMKFRTIYSDPESMLNARAYAIMMEKTVSSDLNTVLSVDRDSLSQDVCDKLNAYSKEQNLGMHVANVIIENIHPPVEVAEVYQNVVNASIQKATMKAAAEGYALSTVSAAEKQKTVDVGAATKSQIEKVAAVSNEVEIFFAACEAYLENPDSYKLWKVTNAYQQVIAGARLYVFTPGTADEMNKFLLTNGQNVSVITK